MGDENHTTLLAVGDVHLGTRPASLPPNCAEWGVDPSLLTPEAALDAVVDRAIAEGVDAVLFAGDVVESTNARFEALRPLEGAVGKLRAAGIRVLGVVGNHDVEALPRLAGLIEGLDLLGVGGHWESRVIESKGRPGVEIVGWSFPHKDVRNSPVADLLRNPLTPKQPGLPRLGLLHGDLDASGGSYAPIRSHELADVGLDGWLLGHIHKPSLSADSRSRASGPCGYLGSLVGLDPTETGCHGPWRIRIDTSGHIEAEQLPIAPLRWESLDLIVGETEPAEDLEDRLLDELERLARRIQQRGSALRALGVRVRLVGPTRHFDAIRIRIERETWRSTSRQAGETIVFIDKVIDGLELALDLEETARGDDPPALLARKLLALQRGGEPAQPLLDSARGELRTLADEARWAPLCEVRGAENPLSDELLTAHLLRAGTAALHSLLSQRSNGDEGSV